MHEHSIHMEEALRCLQENDCKLTNARRVVLEVLFNEDQHMNSSEILERVKGRDGNIGRASIFRALELFTDLNIIHPSNYETQAPRYIVMEENGHHAHLVCTQCKQVIDLGDCRLEGILNEFAEENQFEISGHLLELYGICPKCAISQPENIQE